jgi:hypothetical protein
VDIWSIVGAIIAALRHPDAVRDDHASRTSGHVEAQHEETAARRHRPEKDRREASHPLDSDEEYRSMAHRHSSFGDGKASLRIADAIPRRWCDGRRKGKSGPRWRVSGGKGERTEPRPDAHPPAV